MFPGNPGSVAFYDSYLSLIYEKSPENIACVAVGHANHSNMCTQWGKTYNLKAQVCASSQFFTFQDQMIISPRRSLQVSHKLSFCKELLAANPSAQLVLSGHSVGAYMVIEVIRELPPERVKAGHLLFPTVEHIGSTANGKALGPVFRFAKSLAWLGTGLIACLPKGLQKSLVKAFVKDTSAEGVDAVLTLLHPQVTYNALYLAMHEMDEIKDFHFERYASFQQKLTFYFAKTDDWVLPSTPSTVEKLLPESKVMVGDEGHLHAFVMKPSSNISMASKAFTWISHMLENANNAEQATARAER